MTISLPWLRNGRWLIGLLLFAGLLLGILCQQMKAAPAVLPPVSLPNGVAAGDVTNKAPCSGRAVPPQAC